MIQGSYKVIKLNEVHIKSMGTLGKGHWLVSDVQPDVCRHKGAPESLHLALGEDEPVAEIHQIIY